MARPNLASQVDNAYQKLFNSFQGVARESGNNVHLAFGRGFRSTPRSRHEIEVESLLHLVGWRYKRSSASRKVDILVAGSEWYDCDQRSISCSTLQLAYFKSASDSGSPLLAVHFDFEETPRPAHPLFHMQLGAVKPPIGFGLHEVGFSRCLDAPQSELYNGIAVPTPHMNICSVLLMLTADHLGYSQFNGFVDSVRDSDAVGWESSCESLKDSLSKGSHLHSVHWYQPVSFYVCIFNTKNNRHVVEKTETPFDRLAAHNRGKVPATAGSRPVSLVYEEEQRDEDLALARVEEIGGLSFKDRRKLILKWPASRGR